MSEQAATAGEGSSNEPEYPANTPVAEMSPEDQVGYWRSMARKHEDLWQKTSLIGPAELEALQQAKSELDALMETQKTDQQRLEERAAKAEESLGPLQQENARLHIAIEKGLTLSQAKRLIGSTREELEADAEQLLADLGQQQRPAVPDLRAAAGQRPVTATQSADQWLRGLAGRG